MSDAPTVSVILNAYNAARDLPRALESVFAQTMQDYEIIVYDNCSTDETRTVAMRYAKRIRLFTGDTHCPLGAARNRAIREARGRYIAFLDCDDLWRPTKLEKQLACFDRDPLVGLVTTDTLFVTDGRPRGRLFERTKPARGRVFALLLTRQWISMSSVVIRRSALDSLIAGEQKGEPKWFDEQFEVCEEADVFYRIAHDWALDYVDEPLTVWSVHGGNTSFRRFGAFASETLRILEKLRALYPDFTRDYGALDTLVRNRASFQRAVDLWRRGEAAEARELLSTLPATGKNRLFTLCTYLPGSCFDMLAKLYFALPSWLHRKL